MAAIFARYDELKSSSPDKLAAAIKGHGVGRAQSAGGNAMLDDKCGDWGPIMEEEEWPAIFDALKEKWLCKHEGDELESLHLEVCLPHTCKLAQMPCPSLTNVCILFLGSSSADNNWRAPARACTACFIKRCAIGDGTRTTFSVLQALNCLTTQLLNYTYT